MARKSLKPQLNQIRAWVREGRTDAWIAHQLEVSTAELLEFRRQHELNADAEQSSTADLRDEIEAEIEAARAQEPDEEEEELEEEEEEDDGEESDGGEAEGRPRAGGEGRDPAKRRRRRGRGRGGRSRPSQFEATFDHGEKDGYGLWLDPAVRENPTYKESWAGKRAVTVTIERERIVIKRADSNR